MIALLTFISIWVAGGLLTAPASQPIGKLPTDLSGESVKFSSESGSTIHGWFIPGQKQGGAVVLMHGVRGNRTTMLERTRFLSHAGYAVLLFDFQAHGESPGKQITFGYLESRDARAAVSFLRTRAPGERIGVIGVSMGGAAALLATPPLGADCLVLEMVYPTIDQAIEDRLEIRFGKLGSAIAPLLRWQLRPRLGISTADLRPIDKVGSVRIPKLFIRHRPMVIRPEKMGAFEVKGVPPGEYYLYMRLEGRDYDKQQYYYYPGTLKREDATVINVGLGEKIEGLQFILPEKFIIRTVEGQVKWDNGKPAAGVEVMLLCPQSADPEGFAVEFGPTTVTTDDEGRFRLGAFTGEVYWIEARGSKTGDMDGGFHSPSKRIDVSENLRNVSLVLSQRGYFGTGCSK